MTANRTINILSLALRPSRRSTRHVRPPRPTTIAVADNSSLGRNPRRLAGLHAVAGKVVIHEHAGFDEMSMSARTRPTIDAVANVVGANAQLPPLTVESRDLVEVMGAQRV
jgi:hypothetical protein